MPGSVVPSTAEKFEVVVIQAVPESGSGRSRERAMVGPIAAEPGHPRRRLHSVTRGDRRADAARGTPCSWRAREGGGITALSLAVTPALSLSCPDAGRGSASPTVTGDRWRDPDMTQLGLKAVHMHTYTRTQTSIQTHKRARSQVSCCSTGVENGFVVP